jgi:hypothetical protein
MSARERIELFGGLALSPAEARAAILAYSGADIIREWHTLAPIADVPGDRAWPMPDDSRNSSSGTRERELHYAGIRTHAQVVEGDATLLGSGPSAGAAIADLLWQLVAPRRSIGSETSGKY